MFNLIIGVGEGGSRLAVELSETLNNPAIYLNCADIDFVGFNAPKKDCYVVGGDGTGRDAILGERLVREDIENVRRFIDYSILKNGTLRICLCVGGGGGSGTGFMLPVLEILTKYKIKIVLMFTLPKNDEGLPAKPQALKYLDRVLKKFMRSGKVTPVIIENEYCMKQYRPMFKSEVVDYWGPVNKGVAKSFKAFYNLTKLEHMSHIDIKSGIGALDTNEFLKVLFYPGGFLDIVSFNLETPEVKVLRTKIKEGSKIFNGYDVSTSKCCVVALAMPDRWKAHEETFQFQDDFFKGLKNILKTPYILRSSFFSKNLNDARIMLMFGGITGGPGLDKIISASNKDVEQYKNKETLKGLNI